MKGTKLWGTLIALALASACAPKGDYATAPSARGEAITVVEFSLDGADVQYREPHDTFGLAFAEEVAAELRRRGYSADAVPAAAVPATPLIVRGQVTRIDGGSRALRYWVGFGAGRARFAVAGRLERSDGTMVAQFAEERGSGFGVFGGSSGALLQKCQRALARDVARMIDTGEYRQRAT